MYYNNFVLVQAPLKVDVGYKIFCTRSFTKRETIAVGPAL